MKRVIKIKESELTKLIKKTINEIEDITPGPRPLQPVKGSPTGGPIPNPPPPPNPGHDRPKEDCCETLNELKGKVMNLINSPSVMAKPDAMTNFNLYFSKAMIKMGCREATHTGPTHPLSENRKRRNYRRRK